MSLYENNYNCETCLKRNINNPRMLEQKGCQNLIKGKIRVLNFVYTTCPGRYSASNISLIFNLYQNYKIGIMPEEGGLFKQSFKNILIFNYIDSFLNEKKVIHGKQNNRNNRAR